MIKWIKNKIWGKLERKVAELEKSNALYKKAINDMCHISFADGEHTKCVLAYDKQHAQDIVMRFEKTSKYKITIHDDLKYFKLAYLWRQGNVV